MPRLGGGVSNVGGRGLLLVGVVPLSLYVVLLCNIIGTGWPVIVLYEGLIDPPKAGRGHATLIGPSQTAKC